MFVPESRLLTCLACYCAIIRRCIGLLLLFLKSKDRILAWRARGRLNEKSLGSTGLDRSQTCLDRLVSSHSSLRIQIIYYLKIDLTHWGQQSVKLNAPYDFVEIRQVVFLRLSHELKKIIKTKIHTGCP